MNHLKKVLLSVACLAVSYILAHYFLKSTIFREKAD